MKTGESEAYNIIRREIFRGRVSTDSTISSRSRSRRQEQESLVNYHLPFLICHLAGRNFDI
jgi:hypothetical protein